MLIVFRRCPPPVPDRSARGRLAVRGVRFALWLHDVVESLAVPGQKIESAGEGLADEPGRRRRQGGQRPAVGDELTAPFTRAADCRPRARRGRPGPAGRGRTTGPRADRRGAGPPARPGAASAGCRCGCAGSAGPARPRRCGRSPAGRDLLALRALAPEQPLAEAGGAATMHRRALAAWSCALAGRPQACGAVFLISRLADLRSICELRCGPQPRRARCWPLTATSGDRLRSPPEEYRKPERRGPAGTCGGAGPVRWRGPDATAPPRHRPAAVSRPLPHRRVTPREHPSRPATSGRRCWTRAR